MSTKIYDAFRLKGCNYLQFNKKIEELRLELAEQARILCLQNIGRRAVRILDDHLSGFASPIKTTTPADLASEEFFKDVHETITKNRRHPDCDMEFDLTLHLHQGRFYVLLFTEQKGFIEAFKKKFGADEGCCEEFEYWNNTDPPEDLSAKRWKTRERVWDAIMKNSDAPRMCGCSFTVVQPVRWLRGKGFDEIVKYLDCTDERFQARIERLAHIQTVNQVLEQMQQDDPAITTAMAEAKAKGDYSVGLHYHNKAYFKVRDGLDKSVADITALYEANCQKLTELLPRDPSQMIFEKIEVEAAESNAAAS